MKCYELTLDHPYHGPFPLNYEILGEKVECWKFKILTIQEARAHAKNAIDYLKSVAVHEHLDVDNKYIIYIEEKEWDHNYNDIPVIVDEFSFSLQVKDNDNKSKIMIIREKINEMLRINTK
jgi:hypothetical protein